MGRLYHCWLVAALAGPSGTQFLVDTAGEKNTAIWKAALESLLYQEPPELNSILKQLLVDAVESSEDDKAEYLKELLKDWSTGIGDG